MTIAVADPVTPSLLRLRPAPRSEPLSDDERDIAGVEAVGPAPPLPLPPPTTTPPRRPARRGRSGHRPGRAAGVRQPESGPPPATSTAGPHGAAPHATGPYTAGTHTAGPHTGGPHTTRPHVTEAYAPAPHAAR